jgi:acetyltransferase-like isoleucine patch superfamily enzyme
MKGLTLSFVVTMMSLTLAVHALALLGPALLFRFAVLPLLRMDSGCFALGVVGIIENLSLLLPSAILVTGVTSRLFGFHYSGEYDFDLRHPDVRRWLLHMAVYLPTAVILDFLHAYPLKSWHARLFGARIGREVLLAGLILDPCLIEIGEHSHVGGFVVIFGHSVEADRGRIVFAPVKIGRRCGIGGRAQIMPGAVMEDGSRLGPQSLLIQNGRLAAGATYLGVPARRVIDSAIAPKTMTERAGVVSCK